MNRLATCEYEEEIDDVIKYVKNNKNEKNFIYWGNNNAWDCDYIFIHIKGSNSIKGVLKVQGVSLGRKIHDFQNNFINSWSKEKKYRKYYRITKAIKVNFKKNDLINGDGLQLKTMRESVFIDCKDFMPF